MNRILVVNGRAGAMGLTGATKSTVSVSSAIIVGLGIWLIALGVWRSE